MINLKKYLLPVLIMGTLAFNVASAQLNVVTVSMQKLFDGYYKSEQANARLESIREQAVAEAQQKEQQLLEIRDQINLMQEELENPVLTDASKLSKQADMQNLVNQGRALQQEFQQWQQTTMNNLNQRSQDIRNSLIEEIVKVVNDIALKELSADLVFDTSDILGSGVPTVLYADSRLDITDRVLIKLNAAAAATPAQN